MIYNEVRWLEICTCTCTVRIEKLMIIYRKIEQLSNLIINKNNLLQTRVTNSFAPDDYQTTWIRLLEQSKSRLFPCKKLPLANWTRISLSHVRGKFKVAVTIVAHCSDTGNERAGLTFDLLHVVVRRTTTYSYVHVEGSRRRGNCLGN